MLHDYQIKGLEKLLNSSEIMEIYPMVDRIELSSVNDKASGFGFDLDRLDIDIHLNDDTITSKNMYRKDFDPHYLVDYHIKNYLPYFNIPKVDTHFIVYGPNGKAFHYSY
jgi:hypothetical protein